MDEGQYTKAEYIKTKECPSKFLVKTERMYITRKYRHKCLF